MVFVHGILGSPRRFRFLAEELSKRGYDCVALLLPGHGGTSGDFCRTPRGGRAAYVKARMREVLRTHRRAFVAGYSLGGLIGLDCALDGLAQGVVLLNTPVRLRLNLRAVARSMKAMLAQARGNGENLQAFRENNSISGARLLQYPLWLGQYLEMFRYMKSVRERLGEVRARVLIAQSALDESIQRGSAEQLKAGLSNAGVTVVKLGESGHGFFSENDERKLLDAMLEFMAE